MLPLQIAVHHPYHRLVVAHVAHNHRQSGQPGQLRRVLPPVPRNDLVTSFRPGPGNKRSQHTKLRYALHCPLHGLVIQDLEGMVFEWVQFGDGDLLDLFGLGFL